MKRSIMEKINVKHLINKNTREKQKKTNINEKLYSKCNAHTFTHRNTFTHTQREIHSHVQTRTQLEAVLDALQLKLNNIYIH